ncbi:hypothetical protein [Burkholderia sp. Ac-20344]|uniref:hypothetical protein n=1 Tax=Burkholderia sp. Ac-20344 TaxID=2703890 RepID=UPI00197C603E|nr:hypothetical protein [Burkholderia sp. Ac-20344]MBN3837410.1 hypothetical protein [Burkholderia sp. Ac-20344]
MIQFDSCNSSIVEPTHTQSGRATAFAQHANLRRAESPPIVLGRFYREQLDRGWWPSQAQLAADLNVSASIVTRSIRAAGLPQEVIDVLGGVSRISFRTAEAMTVLVRELGSDVIVRRAMSVPGGTTPAIARSILCTGDVRVESPLKLRLSLGANGRHIRIDSPDIQRVVPHLSILEKMVNALLPSLIGPQR